MALGLRTTAIIACSMGVGFCCGRFMNIHVIDPSARHGVESIEHPATSSVKSSAIDVGHESFKRVEKVDLVKYGFPGTDNLRSFDDFILSYDKRNRTANWVLEHITAEKVTKVNGVNRSKMKFCEDETVHAFHRATNEDYKNSGYDRGHLAAAANHRHSADAMSQTFLLSNVSPQVGVGFNREAWNNLEKYVRAIARRSKNVYVCTGPLYLPRKEPDGKVYVKYEVIGESQVAVPTHFFKVILIEDERRQLDLMAFIMPNQAVPKHVELQNFLVPLETIERAAGLNFFQNIPKSSFRTINHFIRYDKKKRLL